MTFGDLTAELIDDTFNRYAPSEDLVSDMDLDAEARLVDQLKNGAAPCMVKMIRNILGLYPSQVVTPMTLAAIAFSIAAGMRIGWYVRIVAEQHERELASVLSPEDIQEIEALYNGKNF